MFSLDYDKNSSTIGDEPWHNLDTVWSLLRFTWSKKKLTSLNKRTYMHSIGTIKYGYFGIQAVFITPLELNLGSGQWKLPISLITIL